MAESQRLREDEIRPDQYRAEQARRFANDIRRLMARRSEFVDVTCPACDRAERSHAFRKYDLDYVRCTHCATIYIAPRPTPAVLEDYYTNSENYAFWNAVMFPASEPVRREKIFKPRVERLVDVCDRYGVGRELIVEVGAGFGIFCEEMIKRGRFARVVGIEPTPDLARTCRERGIEILETPVEKVDFSTMSADVVASFEVIEHLFDPRAFLVQCAKLVRPGGMLILTCPNGRGFDVEVMGPGSDTVDVEHLNYFNPSSLGALVASCGFEVLEVTTPGKLDAELVRKKVLAGEQSLAGQPFLAQVLVERWDEVGGAFQEFLANNGLSSHMWLVARRRE
jgi:2-polyprenyl-3-methyl-5-hydroxy-6-metoxy-1,4-benzoquinol methylase